MAVSFRIWEVIDLISKPDKILAPINAASMPYIHDKLVNIDFAWAPRNWNLYFISNIWGIVLVIENFP